MSASKANFESGSLKDIDSDLISRISLLWLGRLGDVIVATPFLRALRTRFPKARIRLIASYRSSEVLPLIPFIDDWLVLGKPNNIGAHLRLLRQILFYPSDLVVDLNPSLSKTSTILLRLIKAPIKLSFEKYRHTGILTHQIPPAQDKEPMLERYRRLADALNAAYEPRLELRVSEADAHQAALLFESFTKKGNPSFKMLIHPGNFKRRSSCWKEECFARLSSELLKDPNIDIYYLAGPGEEGQVRDIVRRITARNAPILPRMSLGVLAAFMRHMDLFFCNTTGTTHLAIAVGTPTFAIHTGYTHAIWNTGGSKDFALASGNWDSCRDLPYEDIRAPLIRMIHQLSSDAILDKPK
jgi:ADP-heptose:LPS heptosyltransferase